jgi:hypothetical protein
MREKASSLRDFYLRYGCCMAYISVERDGDEGIGSAFHVGDGIFVTARHVVENARILEMRVTNAGLFHQSDLYPKILDGAAYVITPDSLRMCENPDGKLTVTGGPWYHIDEDVDVAAVRVEGMTSGAHFVPLGAFFSQGDLELSEALVFGYPPVPMTREPVLITARCQVNAVVQLVIGKSLRNHCILSAIPRGGFSWGLAYSQWDFALGVITRSMVENHAPPENGYFAVTPGEAIFECLRDNDVLPDVQKAGWEGVWEKGYEKKIWKP